MASAKRAALLLGRCIQVSREEGVEVVVTMRELDKNLRMYFPERWYCYAYDPKNNCRAGDIILMKKLDEPLTRKIRHEILEVIYPIGDVTDPITGKKVVFAQYREDMEERDRMFGPENRNYTKYITELRNARTRGKRTEDSTES